MMHEPMNIKFTVYNLQFTVSYNLLSVTIYCQLHVTQQDEFPFSFFQRSVDRASWYVHIIRTTAHRDMSV